MVINAFPAKAREQMRAKQAAGSTAQGKKQRTAKDFKECFEQAKHVSREGWCGIPAAAFRAGCVSACRLVGFKMTLAKMSVFILADGFDKLDGTPLVRITKGKPEYVEHAVRNETGVADIRARPMWREGWEAVVRNLWDRRPWYVEGSVEARITDYCLGAGTALGLVLLWALGKAVCREMMGL